MDRVVFDGHSSTCKALWTALTPQCPQQPPPDTLALAASIFLFATKSANSYDLGFSEGRLRLERPLSYQTSPLRI